MSALISYAQNFEDLMLWRALSDVEHGFYIDIGAQSPDVDSVSKMFYEHGWRGMHVDAMAPYAEQLRRARPDETVLHVAISAERGIIKFFQLSDTGLSTTNAKVAADHAASGFDVVETMVPAITLDDLFEQIGSKEVNWLKIDVEGAEAEVLAGWKNSQVLPWVIVIESTLPLSQVQSHEPWEPILLDKGYRFVYFDGLNRFYLAPQHLSLAAKFQVGPNIFDGVALSGTASSSFSAVLNAQISNANQARELAEKKLQESEERHARLVASHDALRLVSAEERERLLMQLEERRSQHDRILAEQDAQHKQYEQISAENEMRQLELMNRVHREHALLQESREECDALRRQLEEASFWKIKAKEFEQRLILTYATSSWRITAPLRFSKRMLIAGFAAPKHLWRLSKSALRSLVLRCMRYALGRPRLKYALARRLERHPGLKGRLRVLSVSAGLMSAPNIVHVQVSASSRNISRDYPCVPEEDRQSLSYAGRDLLERIERAQQRGSV